MDFLWVITRPKKEAEKENININSQSVSKLKGSNKSEAEEVTRGEAVLKTCR